MERIREVIIKGKRYEVETDLSDEDLKSVVEIVNNTILECERETSSQDFEIISIMALLSLAEKLFFCEKRFNMTQKKVSSLFKKLENI
ncbi:MAG: cell division protein ZapA [Candidatus Hydrothermales bacterium]